MIAVKFCTDSFKTNVNISGDVFLAYFNNDKVTWAFTTAQIGTIIDYLTEDKRDTLKALIAECIDGNRCVDSSKIDPLLPVFTIGTVRKSGKCYMNIEKKCAYSNFVHELLHNNRCEIRALNISSTADVVEVVCSMIDSPQKKEILRIYNRFATKCEISEHICCSKYTKKFIYTLFERDAVSKIEEDHRRAYGSACGVNFGFTDLHERRIVINDNIFLELDNGFESARKDSTDWKLNVYNDDATLEWILQKNSKFLPRERAIQRHDARIKSKAIH